MSKVLSMIKVSFLVLYLTLELSLMYVKMKIKFTLTKRRWIKQFKKKLEKEGIKGEKLNEMVKMYSETLGKIYSGFINPFSIAQNLRRKVINSKY